MHAFKNRLQSLCTVSRIVNSGKSVVAYNWTPIMRCTVRLFADVEHTYRGGACTGSRTRGSSHDPGLTCLGLQKTSGKALVIHPGAHS